MVNEATSRRRSLFGCSTDDGSTCLHVPNVPVGTSGCASLRVSKYAPWFCPPFSACRRSFCPPNWPNLSFHSDLVGSHFELWAAHPYWFLPKVKQYLVINEKLSRSGSECILAWRPWRIYASIFPTRRRLVPLVNAESDLVREKMHGKQIRTRVGTRPPAYSY